MKQKDASLDYLLSALKERAKELNCLYQVEEILSESSLSLTEMFDKITQVLPPGWSYPEICQAQIQYNSQTFQTQDYIETEWAQTADIMVQENKVGLVSVSYREKVPLFDEGPFLKEERKLIDTIADRISQTILHRQLMPLFTNQQSVRTPAEDQTINNWRMVLDLLRVTDQYLYLRISRRMLNYLYSSGIVEAKRLFDKIRGVSGEVGDDGQQDDLNRPLQKKGQEINFQTSEEIFHIAENNLSDDIIFSYIQRWIKENKFNFLIKVLENHQSSLADITDALVRYKFSDFSEIDLSPSTINLIKVSLIRHFLTDNLEVINIAKNVVSIDDFYSFTRHLIFPINSCGKLGGKSTGMFIAMRIINEESKRYEELKEIVIPKTWYIASDGIAEFVRYNHLDELLQHKYRDVELIRMEYPNIVQLFKNSSFPPEMVKSIAMALYDFGNNPLIVRSSSLLEDSIGAAFSGKYKSLFLANQGSKKERLDALLDAIAEVYASVFSPDALEYRTEKGFLDFEEEMGIMIQEVVGTQVGNYYLPAFGGVAFTFNEFRWSPRIKRTDGLIRIVPGLGTRAVDRLSNDYPILISPGQPGIRVNAAVDEATHYAPKEMDVINLETNTFETITINELVKSMGEEMPRFNQIFSVNKDGFFHIPTRLADYEQDVFVATFEGLINNTPFVNQINIMLEVLREHYGTPIDIEFAVDDKHFYLLQCRPQSSAQESRAEPVPKGIPQDQVLFSAHKYVSNGYVPDITHLVYVVPEEYDRLHDIEQLKAVGRAVSRLNKILPKRQFILMGPGRWGSRGDIKLGVDVTYSDINNTAVLIEIACKKGTFLPDLSFGTHFFQDLVEASIRYLPLYPDERGNIFNHQFLLENTNFFAELLPEHAPLSNVIKVIDIPKVTDNKILQVIMNGDENEAVGILVAPSARPVTEGQQRRETTREDKSEHWKWRLRMAEEIAATIDPEHYGVKALYVFGSTKNATAGPHSDIDLLIHFQGDAQQRHELELWLDGWTRCLDEVVHLRTGHKTSGILDYHLITDEDITNKTSYAVKIGAVSDAARPLPLRK